MQANRIIDAQGRGIAGATLQILPYERPRSGTILATFTADESGRFAYPSETPDDRPFYLVVSAPGFVTDEWIGNSRVRIKRAGVPVADVLSLDRPVTLAGQVLGTDGEPRRRENAVFAYTNFATPEVARFTSNSGRFLGTERIASVCK